MISGITYNVKINVSYSQLTNHLHKGIQLDNLIDSQVNRQSTESTGEQPGQQAPTPPPQSTQPFQSQVTHMDFLQCKDI